MRRRRSTLPSTDELRERLAINIKSRRERLGISQDELAHRAEIHYSSLWPLESGRQLPRIDSFIRLVGALGVNPNDLTAGIIWLPAEGIVVPGGFEVPDDPELAAEVAALRASTPRRSRKA